MTLSTTIFSYPNAILYQVTWYMGFWWVGFLSLVVCSSLCICVRVLGGRFRAGYGLAAVVAGGHGGHFLLLFVIKLSGPLVIIQDNWLFLVVGCYFFYARSLE